MRSSRPLHLLALLLLLAGPLVAFAADNVAVLAPATTARLLHAKPGERVALAALPSNARAKAAVTLERIEVYAADARIYVVGDTGPVEVPRSTDLHFLSVAGPRIALTLRADGSGGEGLLVSDDGSNYVLAARPQAGSLGVLVERAANLAPDGSQLDFGFWLGSDAREAPAGMLGETIAGAVPAAPDDATRQAVVAIDTDNEFMNLKFANSSANATSYLAALITNINVIYERDLELRLVQGTTVLRPSTTTDSYSASSANDQLDEFGEFWRLNQSGVSRAFAMLLSGKSPDPFRSNGIAWLITSGNYCTYTGQVFGGGTFGHYSVTQVFRFPGSNAGSDTLVTSHELGHNLGANHTHCTNAATGAPSPDVSTNTIDNCYSGESANGCFAGPQQCPAPTTVNGVPNVTGTLMSYCHASGLGPQCGSSLVLANAQRTWLGNRVDQVATQYPSCITPIGSTNQAPTLSAPATIAATEDVAVTVSGVSFGDADAGSNPVTATFSVGAGALNAAAGAGITVGGSSSARTLRGTIAALNAYLAGANLGYQPAPNANGNQALSISINDEGNSGSGGPRITNGGSTFAIAAVNDPPVFSAPGTIAALEDTMVQFNGIGVSDVDSGAANLSVTLAAAQGTLLAPAAAGIGISGSPGASVVLTGTAAALSNYLGSLNMAYTPVANFSGNVTLNLTANDGGNSGSGGAGVANVSSTLQVAAVNDAPTLTVPAVLPIFVSGSGPIRNVVVADVDVAGASMTQTLSVPEGTLAASSQGGVTVTGSGTDTMQLSGTLAALNGFHAPTPRVTYTQAAVPSPTVSLTIQVSDNGNTGSGGARTASAVVALRTGILFMDGFE